MWDTSIHLYFVYIRLISWQLQCFSDFLCNFKQQSSACTFLYTSGLFYFFEVSVCGSTKWSYKAPHNFTCVIVFRRFWTFLYYCFCAQTHTLMLSDFVNLPLLLTNQTCWCLPAHKLNQCEHDSLLLPEVEMTPAEKYGLKSKPLHRLLHSIFCCYFSFIFIYLICILKEWSKQI